MVLKWILISLKSQFYLGHIPGHGIKKPLNPILGEVFRASWSDPKATTNFVCEQVSHHPPITALYMWNDEYGIRGEGYSRVETSFSGSVDIRQTGHAMLHIDKFGEDYLIPLPNCSAHGFLSGKLYPELNGVYSIVSSSGFVSDITFHGAGLLGRGHVNHFRATMYRRDDPEKKALYVVSGIWSDKFRVYKGDSDEVIEEWDQEQTKNATVESCCEPMEEQDSWESRKIWHHVSTALKKADFGTAVDEKSKVEQAQRQMRVNEKKEGTVWEPLLFSPLQGSYEAFDRLASVTKCKLEAEKTKGVWKVNRDKVKDLKHPFRAGMTPLGHLQSPSAQVPS